MGRGSWDNSMNNKHRKTIWVIIILIALFIWYNKNEIGHILRPRPDANSLEFNQPANPSEPKSTIVSTDEKINIDVFEKVHPAVVNIAATTLSVNFWMEMIPKEGQGSGFIIDRKGYILTNNHVVANAQKIIVTMSGGKKIPATLIGRDPDSDLAIIKIPMKNIETVTPLGNSDQIRVGQKAIAIGNPFGLSHTLTTGIISALNRSIKMNERTQIDNLIQTDAAINPGNSGGPLLNSNGEVIGINTAIFSLSGGYQGIGFAIPINRAKEVATQLITSGKVARPWLGITGVTLTKELANALRLEINQGVLIVELIPESPADQAGLRGGDRAVIIDGMRLLIGGDIITEINGDKIQNMKQLIRILNNLKVDESIHLAIFRGYQQLTLDVLLRERPG